MFFIFLFSFFFYINFNFRFVQQQRRRRRQQQLEMAMTAAPIAAPAMTAAPAGCQQHRLETRHVSSFWYLFFVLFFMLYYLEWGSRRVCASSPWYVFLLFYCLNRMYLSAQSEQKGLETLRLVSLFYFILFLVK
jgi:hypothetical protein